MCNYRGYFLDDWYHTMVANLIGCKSDKKRLLGNINMILTDTEIKILAEKFGEDYAICHDIYWSLEGGDHSRAYSSFEVVIREVINNIEAKNVSS
jgi:hypothetical protein